LRNGCHHQEHPGGIAQAAYGPALALAQDEPEWHAPLLWRSEFVALAEMLDAPRYTMDRQVLRALPHLARPLTTA
jgi:hypothetical protein